MPTEVSSTSMNNDDKGQNLEKVKKCLFPPLQGENMENKQEENKTWLSQQSAQLENDFNSRYQIIGEVPNTN